jgi:pyruvyl transferase EpsI
LLLVDSIKRQIRPQDIVTIVGGGNMGSLYPDIEELRQRVIRSFPGNRIVCFPQTLDWNDAPASSRALQRIVRIYARHPDIHVFARESITREKLENLFRAHANVKIGYVPDIVLSATAAALGAVQGAQPDGILLCMRDDAERALDARQRQALEDALAQAGLPMRITDTHAGGSGLDDGRCARLLADKIDEFRVARLVVTDRLHGMILSTLAGTPCLVVPNANHKIRQTWLDWLSDLPQVQFLAPSEFVALPGIVAELLDVERRDPQAPVIDPALYGGLQQALVLR